MVPFRDAGTEVNSFECTVLDCLKGLEKAVAHGWYKPISFDYKEYEFNHGLDNGDMNWIVPRKILAFSSPNEIRSKGLPPEHFIPAFIKMGIKAVIRLNEPLYDAEVFRRVGIEVYDLEFPDGSSPNEVKLLFINPISK